MDHHRLPEVRARVAAVLAADPLILPGNADIGELLTPPGTREVIPGDTYDAYERLKLAAALAAKSPVYAACAPGALEQRKRLRIALGAARHMLGGRL